MSNLPFQPTACSWITICHIFSPKHSLPSFRHSALVDLQHAQGLVQAAGVKTRHSPEGVAGTPWDNCYTVQGNTERKV